MQCRLQSIAWLLQQYLSKNKISMYFPEIFISAGFKEHEKLLFTASQHKVQYL